MMQVIKGDRAVCEAFIQRLKERDEEKNRAVSQTVSDLIDRVRNEGDAAVRAFTQQFDGTAVERAELSREEIKAAAAHCDEAFLTALRNAADRIRAFHARQKQQSWFDTDANGVLLGQRVRALRRVGLYVPGGTAAYPSSLLMNAIPAKIAGVRELIMTTPPGKDGLPDDGILAAALIAGVDRVFTMGGAQAVAALAYGTESVPKVDKVVGPGNIYVAMAKKQLYGVVDIDMIAGPSEILVIADETANPKFVAADLLSQAEHDALASAVLLTTSACLAEAVCAELTRQTAVLSRREIIEKSLRDFSAVILCDSIPDAIAFSEELAPEHLELCVANPMEYLGQIDNVGSVFMGNYTPEPVGDYYAGPNHVLPTGGTARFFSPLSVDCFVKKSQFVSYTKPALAAARADIECLARAEGLTAHANAVSVRFEEDAP